MAEILSIAEHSVAIGTTTYSMLSIPDAKTPLVQEECQRVVRNINLEKLVSDLELCKDLLYLAYNGVAGHGELSKETGTLHITFSRLCGECEAELGNIERQSGQILEKLKLVFSMLLRGQEKIAIDFLKGCGVIAGKLADSSKVLAGRFDELSREATRVLGKTLVVQGQEQINHETLMAQLQDLEAKTVKAQALVKGIAAQKKKLEELYQEAKEKAETEEQRAFVLSVIGAIFQPIAAGIGAFGAVYSGGGAAAAANKLAPTPPQLPADASKAEAKKKEEAAKEKLTEAEKKAKEADAKVVKTEGEKAAADKKVDEKKEVEKEAKLAVDKKPDDTKLESALKLAQKEVAVAKEKQTEANDKVTDSKEEQKEAQAKAERARQAFQAAAKGVEKAGEALMQMGSDYAQIAAGYRKEKQEYLKMLMEKQDMEHDALSSIQEYAVRMKNTGAAVEVVKLTCDSLFQAVGALKQIAVILQDASRFWDNMAQACRALADSGLESQVTAYATLPVELKHELFTSDDFKEQVVRYYAGWKAIQVIAKDYAAATNGVRRGANEDFKKNLPIEQMRKMAIEMGQRLAESTREGVAKNLAVKAELKKEQSAIQPEPQSLPKAS